MILDIADPEFDAEKLFKNFRTWLLNPNNPYINNEDVYNRNSHNYHQLEEAFYFQIEAIEDWMFMQNFNKDKPKYYIPSVYSEDARQLMKIWKYVNFIFNDKEYYGWYGIRHRKS